MAAVRLFMLPIISHQPFLGLGEKGFDLNGLAAQILHNTTALVHMNPSANQSPSNITAMVSFPPLNGADGLKALNDYFLTRSYVTGCVRIFLLGRI